MVKYFYKIKNDYYLDVYAILLFISVSFSFPAIHVLIIPIIVILSIFQFYRLHQNKISYSYINQTYFYLLIYSVIFFRSVHNVILIISLLFYSYVFFKERLINKKGKYITEKLILLFFTLILINQLIFFPYLKGLDTYFYLLFYPILFIFIKKLSVDISKLKSIKILITSVLISTLFLLIINIYNNKISPVTNTFFAESLDLTHVYYGMFLGVACCFLLALHNNNKFYFNKYSDIILFLFFLLILIYIGARTSLLAVFFILTLTLYKKTPLKGYKKGILLLIVLVGLSTLSYKTIPRANEDIKYIHRVYTSIKTNDRQDLIHNSWRNMYQRFLVLDYTFKEIKKHYFLGIGLKNVTSTVSNQIIQDGYVYFKPINTHNQYLHFLLGMGIPGLLFFLYMLLYFYRNSSFTLYFLLFFLIIMLTESILVRVKGISLFFLFILIFSNKRSN